MPAPVSCITSLVTHTSRVPANFSAVRAKVPFLATSCGSAITVGVFLQLQHFQLFNLAELRSRISGGRSAAAYLCHCFIRHQKRR